MNPATKKTPVQSSTPCGKRRPPRSTAGGCLPPVTGRRRLRLGSRQPLLLRALRLPRLCRSRPIPRLGALTDSPTTYSTGSRSPRSSATGSGLPPDWVALDSQTGAGIYRGRRDRSGLQRVFLRREPDAVENSPRLALVPGPAGRLRSPGSLSPWSASTSGPAS